MGSHNVRGRTAAANEFACAGRRGGAPAIVSRQLGKHFANCALHIAPCTLRLAHCALHIALCTLRFALRTSHFGLKRRRPAARWCKSPQRPRSSLEHLPKSVGTHRVRPGQQRARTIPGRPQEPARRARCMRTLRAHGCDHAQGSPLQDVGGALEVVAAHTRGGSACST